MAIRDPDKTVKFLPNSPAVSCQKLKRPVKSKLVANACSVTADGNKLILTASTYMTRSCAPPK